MVVSLIFGLPEPSLWPPWVFLSFFSLVCIFNAGILFYWLESTDSIIDAAIFNGSVSVPFDSPT